MWQSFCSFLERQWPHLAKTGGPAAQPKIPTSKFLSESSRITRASLLWSGNKIGTNVPIFIAATGKAGKQACVSFWYLMQQLVPEKATKLQFRLSSYRESNSRAHTREEVALPQSHGLIIRFGSEKLIAFKLRRASLIDIFNSNALNFVRRLSTHAQAA